VKKVISEKSESLQERKTFQMPTNFVGAALVVVVLLLVIGHALRLI
jgi:type VI protein secretion system component VasF